MGSRRFFKRMHTRHERATTTLVALGICCQLVALPKLAFGHAHDPVLYIAGLVLVVSGYLVQLTDSDYDRTSTLGQIGVQGVLGGLFYLPHLFPYLTGQLH